MAITAAQVKELREKSGAGMMDAKKALVETDGDQEAAMDWLRAKGIAKADKKSGRTAAEGLIGMAASADKGVLVELNSETDFVARNENFQKLVRELADVALVTEGGVEELKQAIMVSTGKTVDTTITEAVATIGENMDLRRVEALEAANDGTIAAYVHNVVAPGMGKLGVLVSLSAPGGDVDKMQAFGRQVAMHVAAVNPLALSPDDLDPAIVERERNVLTEQARASGKPDNVIEKMIEGRMRKYYEEVVLLKQAFVVNPDHTVEQAAEEASKDVGGPIKIDAFVRLALGEGVEKEESDFAAEVAAAAKG